MSHGALPAAAGEPARSGDVRDLSLRDSIMLGLRNNRSLIDAQTARIAGRFALDVAENEFAPRVSFGPYFDWSRSRAEAGSRALGVGATMTMQVPTGGELALRWQGGDEAGGPAARPRYSSEVGLTFKQPLLRGAGTDIGTAPVRTARLQDEIDVLALRTTVADVVAEIVRSYHRHIRAERRVDIAARSLERARDLLTVARTLVEAGRMAARDVVQTRADIARRELTLVAARDELDAARLALIDVLDIDRRSRLRLTDRLETAPEPSSVEEAGGVAVALRNRPDYLQALLGVKTAETRAAVAGNERLWDLSVELSANASHADGSVGGALGGLDRDEYGMILRLDIPIGAATDAAKLAHVNAVTALNRARNTLDETRQRIDIEVAGAVRAAGLSFRRVALARTARRLAEQKMEIENEKLRLGLSTNFRLVAFENDLVAAQNEELEAIVSYHDAVAALNRTLGISLESWGIDFDRLERSGAPPVR